MKLIHGRGFRMDEKRRLVPFIYRQILSVVRCICRQMHVLCIRFADARNEVGYKIEFNKTTGNFISHRNMLVY